MNRRTVLEATLLGTALAAASGAGAPAAAQPVVRSPYVVARDGTKLFVQDWGSGKPVVLLTAWTFDASTWGSHIAALNEKGFRCLAPDRRGHGRSEMPSAGYDLDTLTDDVAAIIEARDLRDVTLVGFSMGTVEALNYLGRYGSDRIARLVLVAPTTPFLVKTEDNPDAVPKAMIETDHAAIARDFAKWIAANEAPFFLPETPEITRTWIRQMMLSVPLPVALACRKTISFSDLRASAARVDCPTLILHGDKDASAPLPLTGAKTAKLIKDSKLIVYEGAPHPLPLTHGERLMADMLAFMSV
ncbi:alpha/beta fold hydrolase [Bradyrhizobium sp. GCM10027634]|uniref:alpha/beta fold hydrolase n=1 Tax=unclassified Bradyrhizobium TaxID=2631580 RepID=UPI00188ACCA5|nr:MULTISPECIES: alpha/beta hydrolase [unclassified Bradyrhizobium]MDN5004904.1 alpha/beta hydrolase [Bradyrhizobium sp. WYCCWR 12677]QOZ45173.1 alpha/beta hydrolase [Bradyrhizobium sp. CCBAU 53340]